MRVNAGQHLNGKPMDFQYVAKVEDGRFLGNFVQFQQLCEASQRRNLIQRLPHARVAQRAHSCKRENQQQRCPFVGLPAGVTADQVVRLDQASRRAPVANRSFSPKNMFRWVCFRLSKRSA